MEENYDLAFRLIHDESLPAGVVARRVRAVPFRLAASRAYLERNGIPKVPEDLGRHDFITAGGPESLSLESPQGTVEIPLRVALRCRTLADVAITVAGGMGLALLPTALLNDPAFVNVLRPVLPEFRAKEFNLYPALPRSQVSAVQGSCIHRPGPRVRCQESGAQADGTRGQPQTLYGRRAGRGGGGLKP